jgi:hypothetical protein
MVEEAVENQIVTESCFGILGFSGFILHFGLLPLKSLTINRRERPRSFLRSKSGGGLSGNLPPASPDASRGGGKEIWIVRFAKMR